MPADKRLVLAVVGVALGAALLGGAYGAYRRARPARWPVAQAPSVASSLGEIARKYPNLQRLVDDPKVGSVLKEFLAVYSAQGIEGAKAFGRERGFLNASNDVTLTLLTESDDTDELEAEIVAARGQVVGRGDQQLDVLLPWSVVEDEIKNGKPPEVLLEDLARLKGVRGVLPSERQDTHQTGATGLAGKSEGVKLTGADAWQAAGFRGAGVRVGILDPEVSRSSRFLGGALPAATQIYQGACVNQQGLGVDDDGLHGPAAAEIVHAMAPDAQLFIACSLGDDDKAINWLVQQGVRIISYSAGGIYGQRNGRGRSQDRINKLTQQGILWVNAAGNEGKVFHRGKLAGGASVHWHAFGPGKTAMGFKTKSESAIKITLIWSQWNTPFVSDYDLYIFDAAMKEVARSENKNTTLRLPSETLSARLRPGSNYFVAIRGGAGAAAAPFVLNVHNAESIELPTPSGSLGQPSDAVGAVAVGAVLWSSDVVTPYSGRGPTEDGRIKPDLSAPTQVTSSVYKGLFAGTSAAAPHVAGAAALVWGRFPQFSRNDVVNFLLARARDLGPAGPDNDYGAGRLDLGDPRNTTATPPRPSGAVPAPAPTRPAPGRAPAPDDDDGGWDGLLLVLFFAGLGGLLFAGGLVALAAMLLRGGKSASRAPAPVAHAPPPPGPPLAPQGPLAGGWVASLSVIAGPGLGQRLVLSQGLFSIGRSPGNHLVIPDSAVSSRHAWIQVDASGCWLSDAGAVNGLFVNNQRVQRHFLRPGDVVLVGPAQLRFEVVAR